MGDKKKKAQMFVKLVSAAGTGFFYEKRKPRQFTEKLEFRKFDPRVNRHVLFTEAKIPCMASFPFNWIILILPSKGFLCFC
ncbi:hypothetical protein LR48_Vigan102s000600 [Vigna angularis]|uniref:50S ribosomal protein L33, chloroplastic n=1 Tax=Phaseolus angularis TaxID=3914 RepID=A0A0L9T435_PHAAN|nr:hypothetical protein LR48_Vigan102s000600 [Vigna angularis]